MSASVFSSRSDRDRKNGKILKKFARQLNLAEPFTVFVGPYFAQSIAERRVILKDAINATFLGRECKLVTSQCCVDELQRQREKLGADSAGKKFGKGLKILSNCELIDCLHSATAKKPTKAFKCICSYLDRKSKRMADAVSDKGSVDSIEKALANGRLADGSTVVTAFCVEHKAWLSRVRQCPGIVSLWLWRSTLVLDAISEASKQWLAAKQLLLKRLAAKMHTVDSEIASIKASLKSTLQTTADSAVVRQLDLDLGLDDSAEIGTVVKSDNVLEESGALDVKTLFERDSAKTKRKRKLSELRKESQSLKKTIDALDESTKSASGFVPPKKKKKKTPFVKKSQKPKKRKRKKGTSETVQNRSGDATVDLHKWFGTG